MRPSFPRASYPCATSVSPPAKTGPRRSLLRAVLAHELHRSRAAATLERAGAYVAGGEDAGAACHANEHVLPEAARTGGPRVASTPAPSHRDSSRREQRTAARENDEGHW